MSINATNLFKNWKEVEQFLSERPHNEDGSPSATKEEIEAVVGHPLKFNDELKIEDPELTTLIWTKEVGTPDEEGREVINYDRRVKRDTGDTPVSYRVYL